MENAKQLLKVKRKQELILNSKNLYQSILVLALPIFLSNFMKAFNNIIDMYWVSNLINPDNVEAAISAVSIPGPVIDITHAIAGGFMTAGAAIISQYLGARQKENANKVAGQLLTLTVITGIIMNIALYILTPQLMVWMGAEGTEYDYMVQYVRIRSFEMVPLFTFYAFQASRNASGDTVTPFILNIIMIVFNIVSSWFFMKFLNMEVRGAAFGTMLANLIIMPIYIFMMFKGGKRYVTVTMKDVELDKHEIARIFKLSWPIAISQGLTSFGFTLINTIIRSLGLATVNAFQVGNRINSLILMPAMGIGSITATFVGQNIGAGNQKRARESVKTAMILSILAAVVGVLIVYPLRTQIIGLFLDQGTESFDQTLEYIFFLLLGLPLMSIFQVFMGSYQGSGETKYSLILSSVRLWIMRLPMLYAFKYFVGLEDQHIWYCMIISNFGSAYLGAILYKQCKFLPKVRIKPEEEKEEELCLA